MDSKHLKDLVLRRHPEYVDTLSHWNFLDQTYKGGRDWFEGNVFQYMKEGDIEFNSRKKRAYRFNHTKEVVDLVNKYLFRVAIDRNIGDASENLQNFWKRSTSNGLSIQELMRVASTKSSILGRVWMVIDNANTHIDASTSKADIKEDSVYAYVVSPVDVLDLARDEFGELLWILIEEHVRDDADPFTSSGYTRNRWRLWTKNSWYLIESDDIVIAKAIRLNAIDNQGEESKRSYRVDSQGDHNLGVVPVVEVDNLISNAPYTVPALINDIAYLDRACANYASNLDAIIQDQTFSQLAMPAQNVLPGDDAYEALLAMGTKRVFLYDGESGQAPMYLSPDPRQAQLILSAISQIINEIYHSVGLAGERTKEDNSKGIDNSSGVAKSKDFDRVVALLCSKADSLELAENKIAGIVSRWHGEDPPEDDLVHYSDTFNVQGLWEEIDIAMKLSVLQVPGLIVAEQTKRLVEKLFPSLPKELKEKMIQEVEAMIPVWQENAKSEDPAQDPASSMIEEAARSRDTAGDTQSSTKARETAQK